MDRNIVFCRLALIYSGLLENEINENQKENQRESFLIFVGFLFYCASENRRLIP